MPHDVNAGILGTMALVQALFRHLQAKGLLSDQEFTELVNSAHRAATQNEDGEAISAFIRAATGGQG